MENNSTRIVDSINHILQEVGLNLVTDSIKKCDYNLFVKAHQSIHEFMILAPKIITTKEEFNARSAFLLYHSDIFDSTHTALLNALQAHYNSAFILLRSSLETIIKGALWECLAHKKYREKADYLKGSKRTKNILQYIEDLIDYEPNIEREFEENSVSVFDKIAIVFEDKKLEIELPSIKKTIKQLSAWKMLTPIQDEFNHRNFIYQIYSDLSKDVHVIPDETNAIRRILWDKTWFKTTVLKNELNQFLKTLHHVMEIAIVVELNLFQEFIRNNPKKKFWLQERMGIIKDLGLKHVLKKINDIIEEV